MGKTLSIEERNRAAKLVGQGYDLKQVAKVFGVSPRAITGKAGKRVYVPGKLRRSPHRG